VNGACDRVTYQKLVMRSRYVLVRCAVGIWLSHQRDDTVTAGASVDVQRHAARPHLLSRYGVTLRGNVTSVDPLLRYACTHVTLSYNGLSILDGR